MRKSEKILFNTINKKDKHTVCKSFLGLRKETTIKNKTKEKADGSK